MAGFAVTTEAPISRHLHRPQENPVEWQHAVCRWCAPLNRGCHYGTTNRSDSTRVPLLPGVCTGLVILGSSRRTLFIVKKGEGGYSLDSGSPYILWWGNSGVA
jgi:hypothetical protein